MKKSHKKAFSLIEVLVSMSILSIAVFWVYKLIWENTKLISNSDNYVQLNNLFYPLQECLNYLDFSNFPDKNIWYNFNFWPTNTNCLVWNSNIVSFDNIGYNLSWEITQSWSNFLDWSLKITADWVWVQTQDFRQIK